jgi:hypothetical protein
MGGRCGCRAALDGPPACALSGQRCERGGVLALARCGADGDPRGTTGLAVAHRPAGLTPTRAIAARRRKGQAALGRRFASLDSASRRCPEGLYRECWCIPRCSDRELRSSISGGAPGAVHDQRSRHGPRTQSWVATRRAQRACPGRRRRAVASDLHVPYPKTIK